MTVKEKASIFRSSPKGTILGTVGAVRQFEFYAPLGMPARLEIFLPAGGWFNFWLQNFRLERFS